MFFVSMIPTLLYILIIYNVVAFSGDGVLAEQLFEFTLMSGGKLSFSTANLLVALGVVALYIEVLKSTRSTNTSIIEHGLSMLLFVVFLVEFIVVKQAGTATFLILTLMQLLDVVAGFTISISGARRDFTHDPHH